MQVYLRIFPFGTVGGDQVNSISVSERARATTFCGFSGTGAGVVDRNVVTTVVVGSGVVVGGGVVTGRGTPASKSISNLKILQSSNHQTYWPIDLNHHGNFNFFM